MHLLLNKKNSPYDSFSKDSIIMSLAAMIYIALTCVIEICLIDVLYDILFLPVLPVFFVIRLDECDYCAHTINEGYLQSIIDQHKLAMFDLL